MKYNFLIFIAAILFMGCNEKEPNIEVPVSPEEPEEIDVYVAGSEMNAQGIIVAKVWKNGIAQDIKSDVLHSVAVSVFVSDNDIYVAGKGANDVFDGNIFKDEVAIMWKNGVPLKLSEESDLSSARSVFVSGSDVYVAGYDYNEGKGSVAKLWKNGIDQNLAIHEYFNCYANSVYVSGNDVYVAGWSRGDMRTYACLWKNNELQVFSERGGYAFSVYGSNNDVYVAGDTGGGLWWGTKCVAILWKNGEAQYLKEATFDNCMLSFMSVYVFGDDIYVAGAEKNNQDIAVAQLCKNGECYNLTDWVYDAYAHSVYVFNNDVYVVGCEKNAQGVWVAKLWKNGVAYDITDGTYDASANSVFVVEK